MTDIATSTFTLNDVVVGKTVLRGRSTSGSLVAGTVSRILPGVGFDVGSAFLWREFAIVTTGTAAAAAAATGDIPSLLGYPDCEFWAAQGVEPLFVATASNYFDSALPTPVEELRRLLEESRDVAEGLGGAYLAAWKRQFATTEPRELEGEWLTLEDLAGLGIPAGYFIKPDPVLTRVETRRYLLEELERYLQGPLLEDAVAASASASASAGAGAAGPASRMARLYSVLKAAGKLPLGSVSEQMGHVAKWIFTVIQTSLTLGAPSAPTDYEELAMAFWDVDLLPNKKTIGSYWDYSPFEALRRAPPLTSTEAMAEAEDTVPPLPASPTATATATDEEDYSDMPPLVPIDSSFRGPVLDSEDYSDMPGLISLDELQQQQRAFEEEEEYVVYSRTPQLPQSLIDTVGGSVEALFNFALRPVTVPVWGIALAFAILPTLLMSKC